MSSGSWAELGGERGMEEERQISRKAEITEMMTERPWWSWRSGASDRHLVLEECSELRSGLALFEIS